MKKDYHKRLVIVRHAKSSWKDFSIKDFDRPLNPRGKKDAPFMANKFKSEYFTPDLLLSSPALRAKKTAEVFASSFEIEISKISFEKALYHAEPDEIESQVELLDNNINSAMLFAHNPGLTSLANDYSEAYIENIPTTGICIINSTNEGWSDFFKAAYVSDFIFPKMFQ